MWSFALAALVLVMIPGPDQALVTRNAIAGGRPAGMFTVLGGSLGLTVHASAASFGVSALLLASSTAFTALKVVGTLYLIWMGIQTLREARRSSRAGVSAAAVPKRPGSPLRYLRQGFLSNALNPKVALFFVTLLPQFMSPDSSTLRRGLLLSAVFAAIYLAWFTLYVLTVDLIGAQLRRPRVKAAIERVTGFLLVGFAVRLVLETN